MIESSFETKGRIDVVARCCGKAASGKFPRGREQTKSPGYMESWCIIDNVQNCYYH